MNNGTVKWFNAEKAYMDLSQMTQTVRMCSFTILPSFPKATRALTKDRKIGVHMEPTQRQQKTESS